MNYNRERDKIERKIKIWERKKEIIILKQDLEKSKKQIKNRNKQQKQKMATSKFLMFFLFISCTIIEFFTLMATLKTINMGTPDFGPLQTLIGVVVAQVIGYSVYSLKSMKQNTKGGIVYQTAILEAQKEHVQENNDQEAVG